jgi:hypothetical protein
MCMHWRIAHAQNVHNVIVTNENLIQISTCIIVRTSCPRILDTRMFRHSYILLLNALLVLKVFYKLALLTKRYCEVVHAHERVWVLLPEHYLHQLQRLPVHRDSVVAPLSVTR